MLGIKQFGGWSPKKRRYKLPTHKNQGLEIVLVTKGELLWEVEGRREWVRAGSLFFTLPWQAHGGVEREQPASELFFIILALDKVYSKATRRFGFHSSLKIPAREETLISKILTRPSNAHAQHASDLSIHLLPLIVKELSSPGTCHQTFIMSLARALIIEVARAIETTRGRSNLPADGAFHRVKGFVQSLAHRCSEPWTLLSMSEACSLKRTQFAKLVSQQTGDHPIALLNRLRVQKAEKLLMDTRHSVIQIAIESGFSSSQYFATVFKQYTSLDPTRYRKTRLSLL